MIDCIILGDSIAVGVQAILKDCHLYGRGGINSWQWNKTYPVIESANIAVISLGTNDHIGIKTREELESMRAKVKARRVFWILPHGNLSASLVPINALREVVRSVATKHGDQILDFDGSASRDGIHPSSRGYKELAARVEP